MTECPHEHQPDAGLQTFRDIIREETDGGRDLVRFFTNAMFDKGFIFKDEPWNYMYTVHGDTIKANSFASDGHDPFIYDSDLGRYVPADDRLRPFLADYMKHEWSPARVDLILTWYRDRAPRFWDPPPLNPVGAQRLYKSVWEIFRIKTHKRTDRRVLQGIQLIKEDAAP